MEGFSVFFIFVCLKDLWKGWSDGGKIVKGGYYLDLYRLYFCWNFFMCIIIYKLIIFNRIV